MNTDERHIVERDYELVKQALLRRHDLDPDGVFDAETDSALLALDALRSRATNSQESPS